MPVPTGPSGGVWGTTRVHTTCEENTLDEDEFYGYDLDHVSIDDDTDGDLSLTEELTADIGPL